MKKSCELCKRTARIHCESDQARLCWDCDAKVHSANFLVARHSRNLLCRLCQSPTAWSAAGSKLEPTYSYCRKCAGRAACGGGNGEDEEKAVKEEVAEIHVLPSSPPPPPESSLSGGDGSHGGEAAGARKRVRIGNNDRPALEDLNICTPSCPTAAEAASAADSVSRGVPTLPRSIRRTDNDGADVKVSKSSIVEAAKRSRREETVSGEEMPEYHKMSAAAAGAVDLNLTLSLGLFSR